MKDAAKDPDVRTCCLKSGRAAELQAISSGFEACQKSLTDYLKSKRNAFPRFFFISDDELLTVLGSSEVDCVQEHMLKVSHTSIITVVLRVYMHSGSLLTSL